MTYSDYTPKGDNFFGENDSDTSCEPTILQIILKTGDVPSCEPTILRIRKFEKLDKWDFKNGCPYQVKYSCYLGHGWPATKDFCPFTG